MLENGVPTKIVDLLRAYYENTLSNVRIYGELTELFEIAHVVQDARHSQFFNYIIDLIKNTHWKKMMVSSLQHKKKILTSNMQMIVLCSSAKKAQNIGE